LCRLWRALAHRIASDSLWSARDWQIDAAKGPWRALKSERPRQRRLAMADPRFGCHGIAGALWTLANEPAIDAISEWRVVAGTRRASRRCVRLCSRKASKRNDRHGWSREVNRTTLLQILDQPLSAYCKLAQDPCALSEMVISAEGVRVMRINESTYLRSL